MRVLGRLLEEENFINLRREILEKFKLKNIKILWKEQLYHKKMWQALVGQDAHKKFWGHSRSNHVYCFLAFW